MPSAVRWRNVVRLIATVMLVVSVGACVLILGVGDASPRFLLTHIALPWVIATLCAIVVILATVFVRPQKAVGGVLLTAALPDLTQELYRLLEDAGEEQLGSQLQNLRIVDRCRCSDDFCSTFYVQPKPKGSYGPMHRNVPLTPERGMLILDVVEDKIVAVEVLYRNEVGKKLLDLMP